LPESGTLFYWVVMPLLGAIAVLGALQGILKIAWMTGISLVVSLAVHAEPDALSDLMEPVLEQASEIYDDISDDARSIL
jgi:hypothetical protein